MNGVQPAERGGRLRLLVFPEGWVGALANRIGVEQRKVVDKTGSARERGFAATVSACNDSKSGKGHRAFVWDPWEFCWRARSARISCKRWRLRASWARASSAIFFATSTQFTAMGLDTPPRTVLKHR